MKKTRLLEATVHLKKLATAIRTLEVVRKACYLPFDAFYLTHIRIFLTAAHGGHVDFIYNTSATP